MTNISIKTAETKQVKITLDIANRTVIVCNKYGPSFAKFPTLEAAETYFADHKPYNAKEWQG